MLTAEIIPFPAPLARDDTLSLTHVLQDLQAALQEQNDTMQSWRFALAELGIGVAGLSHALLVHEEGLEQSAAKLTSAKIACAKLDSWADRVVDGLESEAFLF